ncbi:hypothetical protein Bbelb_054130 [Branchiostoma belcheri]|nr:hypothetical protein Bbelb_054130 [Branchiostoma belcheri]
MDGQVFISTSRDLLEVAEPSLHSSDCTAASVQWTLVFAITIVMENQQCGRVLSGFVNLILARMCKHEDVESLAAEGSVPIVNALSELYHPLQILADMQTLQAASIGLSTNLLH